MRFRKNITTPEKLMQASFIADEAAQVLFSRLEWMTLQPKWIMNVGYVAEEILKKLITQYSETNLIVVENDEQLLLKNFNNHVKTICADNVALPIQSQCINLLSANLQLPWFDNIAETLKEYRRCLANEAVLLLSAFGPDTLKECHHLFSKDVMPNLIDMHDIGDLLVQVGFADPVLEVEYVTTTYSDAMQLANDLYHSSMINLPINKIAELIATLPKDETSKWSITYEIIYAHAFNPLQKQEPSEDGSIKISLSQLRKQLLK